TQGLIVLPALDCDPDSRPDESRSLRSTSYPIRKWRAYVSIRRRSAGGGAIDRSGDDWAARGVRLMTARRRHASSKPARARTSNPRRGQYSRSLKFGAPGEIRTHDLCLGAGWRAPAHQRVSMGRRCGPSMAVIKMADRSIAAADHSIAAAEHSRAMDHSIAGTDHSIAGTERSIAGTERRTPGMVRREGSPLSRRHVLVSPASPPQRSSLRQSEAFS